jgi:DNA-3-methyladenine glycosylase II
VGIAHGTPDQLSMPERSSYRNLFASCVREVTSSLRNALRRWYSTVLGLMLMQPRTTEPALADPDAPEFLREADPVLARIIGARPDFRPRAWTQDLPALDAFSTLIFQVIGQQLSVRATRTILGRLEEHFGGRLPTPAEMLAADPDDVRSSGMSARKTATLREVAQRFVDGRLSDNALSAMSDEDVAAALTSIPGIGPWTATGFLLVALDRPDVFLTGDLALRRAVKRAYAFDHLPTDDEMLALADRWRPYRSLAVRYLFASELDEPTTAQT